MKERVQKSTKRQRQPPVRVRDAIAAARRFPDTSEEWYPDPFVPEHHAAVVEICADKRKHRSRTVAKQNVVVPRYICGGAGGKKWLRRNQAATVVRDNAMRWEGNLRAQLQLSLDLDIDVFNCDVAHLNQLQVSRQLKLTKEQSRFIDMITCVSEIREALDSFLNTVEKTDGSDGAKLVKEEGAVLAARLISRSMSLAGMAAEVVMDEEITKRECSVEANQLNAQKNRKVTADLEAEIIARMEELTRSTDLSSEDAAKLVEEELKQEHDRSPVAGTIYKVYLRHLRRGNFTLPAFRLLAAPEGMNDNEDISTCKRLAMSPLDMALWHLHDKHGSMND